MRATVVLLISGSFFGCATTTATRVEPATPVAVNQDARREQSPAASAAVEEDAEWLESPAAAPMQHRAERLHLIREDIVRVAQRYVGVRSLREVTAQLPDDCTGFVRLVYDQFGIALMDHGNPKDNGVTAMWRAAQAHDAVVKKTPGPGDLVFFRETYDRNGDGKRNDGLTHVGIVEEVLEDGTVVFLHRGGKGVSRSRFNPGAPTVRRTDDGAVLNDYLRPKSGKLRAYTAGELWAGAASAPKLR